MYIAPALFVFVRKCFLSWRAFLIRWRLWLPRCRAQAHIPLCIPWLRSPCQHSVGCRAVSGLRGRASPAIIAILYSLPCAAARTETPLSTPMLLFRRPGETLAAAVCRLPTSSWLLLGPNCCIDAEHEAACLHPLLSLFQTNVDITAWKYLESIL